MIVDKEKRYAADGGPAYPYSVKQHDGCVLYHYGMSLRDYFAAQVMERMISLSQDRDGGWSDDNVAHGCYQLADAMLRARAQPTN